MKKILCVFICFLSSLSAQELKSEFLGRVVCDRMTVSDFRESAAYLYVLSRGWEGGGISRLNKDGSQPRLLDGGNFDSFVDAGSRILVWTSSGEMLELDDSGPGLSLIASGIEARDPPCFFEGSLYYAKEGKGLYRRALGSKEEIFVSKEELIFATACEAGIAGWLPAGDRFSLTVLDPKSGKARSYLQDFPGFLYAGSGMLYYGSFEGGIQEIDLKSGAIRKLSKLRVEGRMALADGRLWAADASGGGRLQAIDLKTARDEALSPERGCRVLASNPRGIWYARRPAADAGLVFGSGGNESLCFWATQAKGNPQRILAAVPFQMLAVSNGYALGRFPAEGQGLWALRLSDMQTSQISSEPGPLAAAWFDGGDAFFLPLGQKDEGPVLRASFAGTKAPATVIASCAAALPAGDSILYARGPGPALYISPLAGAVGGGSERLLHPGPLLRMAWEGGRAYALVKAEQSLDLSMIDAKTGKISLIKSGLKPGMGKIILAERGALYYNDGPELRRYDALSGSDSLMASIDEGFVMDIALSQAFLYFSVDRMGGDGIYRLPLGGGAVTKIVDGELFGLAADGGFLYWFSDWVEQNELEKAYSYRLAE